MGSLLADSTSRVEATRSWSVAPAFRRSAKTAAASVEPTIAPTSIPCSHCRPSTQAANAPVRPAVTTTPSVARLAAGQAEIRKVSRRVRIPPSKMMTARASVPMTYDISKSSKRIPPGPSSPASMPRKMKTRRSGAPRREETSLATMLMTSSSAPIRMTVFQASTAER